MCAEMKWPGCEARRGRSCRVDSERSTGVEISGLVGTLGSEGSDCFMVFVDWDRAAAAPLNPSLWSMI